jgi:hypothetical protein
LSFSIFGSVTRYATRSPSGEILGDETRASRSASIVPNSFFPSLLRGAGVSCLSFVSWHCTFAGTKAAAILVVRVTNIHFLNFALLMVETSRF